MSAHRATNSTSVRETTVRELTIRICQAVDTTKGKLKDEEARPFLPKTDLKDILDGLSLQRLITELVRANSGFAPVVGDGDSVSPSNQDTTIDNYVYRTIGTPNHPECPPRVALLALFLYAERPLLLSHFTKWLINPWPGFPSDENIPLDKPTLIANRFPSDCYRSIFDYQNIFRPVLLRQDENNKLRSWDRLPYIGRCELIKEGSSGSVYRVEIAQGHWEIKSGGHYIPGNPDRPLVMAIKEFRKVPNGRTIEEATKDFHDELGILKEIHGSRIKHEMVMLDLGSITIRDGEGIPVSHSIIFELATFSLGDFLKTEKAEKRRKTSVLFAKLADLVKALEHLHRDLDLLHLDIKPDNILVFEGEPSNQDNEKEDEEKLLWKLSDFGLARKKRDKARVGLGGHYWHSSYQESRSSNISATRPAGVYQAPEVQQPGSSGVGKRSDVWSMGCVTLMVLAFATYSVPGVKELESQLFVKFKHWGGSQSLFYHRSDSYLWGAELLSVSSVSPELSGLTELTS
ncbi:SPS1, Serine/threonine protein kinase [Pyrenophora tritici-repentis]|uniref:Serine/threonine protein kinase n=2 Tax=Pyrenophora tritici-repentis TaxID=45151 RepID=A0A834RVB2_9PLEO|nr:uncharacterized protein PTRG_05903 [Pyrenophora tritici-repentis Pt-1C-BFP]EDU48823.1 conserved hypothetical protein [Pyrenophora tritici-repentis Pt-1C-BFP]KAF7570405.1 SPS1, Serine/threonine protein kinase [Pyrenophora tritici-repentis]KAI1508245.1 Serine/threonine protein kinase [Pyrenophora tritici-repentis]